MKNKKHYYTELHTTGFKHTNKFSGFDSACAHFSTDAKPHSVDFVIAMQDAIELIGGQQVSHGWLGYTIGKTFVQTGNKEITCMSPAYYEGHRSEPVFEEVI